jgi:hypothetical protein
VYNGDLKVADLKVRQLIKTIYQEIIFLQLFGKIHCLLTTLETAENKYQCSADSVSRTQCKHKNGVKSTTAHQDPPNSLASKAKSDVISRYVE